MTTLSPTARRQLERANADARDVAEEAARAALQALAVGEREPYEHLNDPQRHLRRRLRVHARQLGDRRDPNTGEQAIDRLVQECAYEHWYGMLFARFLAESNLLIEPDLGVPVSLDDCEDLAKETGRSGLDKWTLAARFAHRMLPQVFRPDLPVLELCFAREHRLRLEALLEELPAEAFAATDALGWVYQFWQARRKDEVNRAETKIGADELPAVTQLFTEPYMVSFLLDNSLGAWWAAHRLGESDWRSAASEAELRQRAAIPGIPLRYLRFVKQAGASEESAWQPAAGTFNSWPDSLVELKLLDPCCGSGHFLVAAFAMLVPMRMALEGLSAQEAVDAVLRDNLHGLEIDARCVEIAAFALALAAWRYPDAGGCRPLPVLNLACSGLSVGAAKERWTELAAGRRNLRIAMDWLHDAFKEAPTLGSLLNPAQTDAAKVVDWRELSEPLSQALAEEPSDEGREAAIAAQGVAQAAELLAGQYHLVVTNVPYLARGKQREKLRKFCADHHPAAKNDLATVFLERCLALCTQGGTASLVLPQNWLFLTSYRKLREKLLTNETWNLIAWLGPGAFETISGEVVKVALLTLSRGNQAAQNWSLTEAFAANSALGHHTADAHSVGPVQDAPPSRAGRHRLDTVDAQLAGHVCGASPDPVSLHELGASDAPSANHVQDAPGGRAGLHELDVSDGRSASPAHAGLHGLDVSTVRSASEKAAGLRHSDIRSVEQAAQLGNPDARVTLTDKGTPDLLGSLATGLQGIATGDYSRFGRLFWELAAVDGEDWVLQQSTVEETTFFQGKEHILRWENGGGALAKSSSARVQGLEAWNRWGVAVSQMRTIPVALHTATSFDNNTSALIPKKPAHLAAIWCYCSSPEYHDAVRRIDQKLNVTNATLTKVPFDLERWTEVARREYPNGLPRPYSDDPTQWIFHGHPCGAVIWDDAAKRTAQAPLRTDATVLHIAIARLLGYRWPAELDADMELADEQRDWAARCDALLEHADADGIVCIPPLRGERPAAERLRHLLTAAFGKHWNEGVLNRLLAAVGCPSLDDWLRNRFFEEHCKLFHHRPFIWHVWDGRKRDGFHALVNYHKLAAADNKGRQCLEALTHSYLGDWITRQQDGISRNEPAAEDRLTAALQLKSRLSAIAEGEPPHDLFIRWKPLQEQPLGWQPDLNDGVRLNIRPFMADDLPGGKKGTGVLRTKPSIHWRKDRGREPFKEERQFPWFWEDGKFTGERINDQHFETSWRTQNRSNIPVGSTNVRQVAK